MTKEQHLIPLRSHASEKRISDRDLSPAGGITELNVYTPVVGFILYWPGAGVPTTERMGLAAYLNNVVLRMTQNRLL